ncbi:RNA polymerase subunit sigma-70 [Streptomyces sp. J2-1]|uniref:sigma factor-like helix-turn-helix DNA-binding protein n=1 Tax=Streptomyces corallincola TaxID=2851888 RepID=UPI001C38C815|nr:sigma factor-like helix-turn-helix DNA-binding protein [Streptomyces corallincola]MBV2356463.1 RNA polymerase subunit sigma-70 [Streptomyces corallincola]
MPGPEPSREARRSAGFAAFTVGAAGRLLHTATLLTAEPPDANPAARRLLRLALARTYADWHRLRDDDPYDHARRCLADRFATGLWLRHGVPLRARPPAHGPLAALPPRQRLILVLRLYEGVPADQTAALLGLPLDRVHTLCERAVTAVLHPEPAPVPRGARPRAATP